METLIQVLRAASLAAFAVPLLLRFIGPVRAAGAQAHGTSTARVALLANAAAFLLFFALLIVFRGGTDGPAAPAFAATGCLLAAAGGAVILRSRIELGAAWSLVAKADEATGLITTGPYRLIRHPIYLGFLLLTAGQALAFASWPAALVLLAGIGPSFAWRAVWEERLLTRTFGERYDHYRRRTRMVIPYLL